MGCCSSSSVAANLDTTFCPGMPKRTASKRSYASRLSFGSSSGVFSRCTTPSRRSIASGRSTPTRQPAAPAAAMSEANNFNYQNVAKKRLMPKAFERLAVCDDFYEGTALPPHHQRVEELERSFGYFSEGVSDGSHSSESSKRILFRTQNISARDVDASRVLPASNLAMEMYMMSHTKGIMPKTSSPAPHRRDRTFDVAETASYQKWRHYLQSTPAYMLHNVTCIPEAIAGHFSPADFPAYSDLAELAEMDSAPKRFKLDAADRTHTIRTSTDL